MRLTRLRGLRHHLFCWYRFLPWRIRMQLTRLRGLRLTFSFIHSGYSTSIRMQLTRLRGLRPDWAVNGKDFRLPRILECSWPDLGDWDFWTNFQDRGSLFPIRMQLTRLRGLRLSTHGVGRLYSWTIRMQLTRLRGLRPSPVGNVYNFFLRN